MLSYVPGTQLHVMKILKWKPQEICIFVERQSVCYCVINVCDTARLTFGGSGKIPGAGASRTQF